ncbi:hypothetical protein ABVT39_016705 [Epinephelus coioides]
MQSDSVPIQLPSNELVPLKHLRSVQSDSVPTQLPINELAPLKHLHSVQSDSVPTQLPINELAPLKHLRSVQSDSVPTQLPINELAPRKNLRSVQSNSVLMLLHTEQHSTIKDSAVPCFAQLYVYDPHMKIYLSDKAPRIIHPGTVNLPTVSDIAVILPGTTDSQQFGNSGLPATKPTTTRSSRHRCKGLLHEVGGSAP